MEYKKYPTLSVGYVLESLSFCFGCFAYYPAVVSTDAETEYKECQKNAYGAHQNQLPGEHKHFY